MNLSALAQAALALIQQAAPGMTITADALTLLGVAKNVAVQIVKKGRQLVTYLITHRQDEATGATPEKKLALTKRNVAILVDINRRMLMDVAAFLEQQKIDAELLLVTNDPAYGSQVKFISPEQPADWEELVREFNATMNEIKHALGGVRVHIFLSTPLPLAFGLGSVWGTVDEATVYHWEKQNYYPVMKISRELRQ
jgi:hypothetical protein